MNKLTSTAAVATFLFAGTALSGQASAQDQQQYRRTHHYQEASNPPLGDGGARWAGKCWIPTAGSLNSLYLGYWGECPKASSGH